MQDQTRNLRQSGRLGTRALRQSNLEVRIRAARSLASCVLDHRGRRIDSAGEAAGAQRCGDLSYEIARTAAHVEHALPGLNASRGDQSLKRGSSTTEEEELDEEVV